MNVKPKVKRIRLTANEAYILWYCAGNLKDEFDDFFSSFYEEKRLAIARKAFESGMDKLSAIYYGKATLDD